LRINVVLVASVAVIMATWKSTIYELVAGASILMLVSLFVPLTAGLYWKKAAPVGALLSLFIGMAAYLAAEAYLPEQETHLIGLLASGLAMIVGSFLFPTKIPVTHALS
jgi:Na+/proline symporter